MSGVWAKLAADLDRNPKIRKGGRLAREVFTFALRVNADLGSTGRVPREYLEGWYVAEQLMMAEAEAEQGLERALKVALLRDEGDEFVIVGWDPDEWGRGGGGSMTEAERKRLQREAKRKAGQGLDAAPPQSGQSGHVRTRLECPDHSESDAESDAESDQKQRESARPDARPAFAGDQPTNSTVPVPAESVGMGAVLPLFAEQPPAAEPSASHRKPQNAPGRAKRHPLASSPHLAAAERLWARQERLRQAARPGLHHLSCTGKIGAERLERIIKRLEDGWTERELEMVLDEYGREAKAMKSCEYLDGTTNWRPQNVDRTFGKLGSPRQSTGGQTAYPNRSHVVQPPQGAAYQKFPPAPPKPDDLVGPEEAREIARALREAT